MRVQNPVIVIPGITASDLLDDYPLGTETLWSMVLNRDYERIALHPDDLRYEAIEPAHVFPGRAFEIYNDLIKALRHELSAAADRPTPVFAFSYDWRADVRTTAQHLGRFVDEVIARTQLLKHYGKNESLKVDLVGHSMGGLIIAEYLSQFRDKARVGKVATIGTPFRGAVEAVVKITTGMSLLSGSLPAEREREAARLTPAVYQLLPSYDSASVDRNGKRVDLFDPGNMQPSIVDSLSEFVRLYAVDTPGYRRKGHARRILVDLLSGAKAHRENVERLKLGSANLTERNWLAIVGINEKTRVQVMVENVKGKPRFVVNESMFVSELSEENPASRRTGDGTVPLQGAIPPFIPEESIVCVTRGDFEVLEARDRLLAEAGGLHGLLPAMNLVQRLVVKHLWNGFGGRVWGKPLPGVDVAKWNPPVR